MRLGTHFVGNNLVTGNTCLDVDGGFARVNASEIGTATAAMVAGAIKQCASVVLRQVAEQCDIFPETVERL